MIPTEYIFTKEDLSIMQKWTLQKKIQVTQTRLIEWWSHFGGKIYISFSGGKDSTVLADIAARLYKEVFSAFPNKDNTLVLVFADTGLEYPEIRSFTGVFAEWLRATYEIPVILETVRPEMTFPEVLTKYGYPVISKEVAHRVRYAQTGSPWAVKAMDGKNTDGTHSKFRSRFIKYQFLIEAPFKISDYCCTVMKKRPLKIYQNKSGRVPVIGMMAAESQNRENSWRKAGCNAFSAKKSSPMSFWLEQDVLHYLKDFDVPFCPVYGEIVTVDPQMEMFDSEPGKLTTTQCNRTGCVFCMFGIKKDPRRFVNLKRTHPKLYRYCIGGGRVVNGKITPDKSGLGMGKILDYIGIGY